MTPSSSSVPVAIGIQHIRGASTGVSTYSAMLCQALRGQGGEWLAIDPGSPESEPGRAMRWLHAARPGPRKARRDKTAIRCRDLFREAQVYFDMYRRLMPIQCDGPPGIVHWTYPVPVRLCGWRNVYTFHDTIPLDHPELSPIRANRYRRMLEAIVATATRIVTVSNAARSDVARWFGDDPRYIVDLGEAVDVGHVSTALPGPLAAGRYLVCCGTIEPRKNIARLVAAWRQSGIGLPLVLAGPAGWRSAPILASAGDVVHLHYLSRDVLLSVIAGARALLMPSLAEGFGLPVAEAMMLGTPVITSARGALAETAGGAALLVNPTDQDALASALSRIAVDDDLCARLSRAGKERSLDFTADAFGRRLTALYEELRKDG